MNTSHINIQNQLIRKHSKKQLDCSALDTAFNKQAKTIETKENRQIDLLKGVTRS